MSMGPIELLIVAVICLFLLILPAAAGLFFAGMNSRLKQTEARVRSLERQLAEAGKNPADEPEKRP